MRQTPSGYQPFYISHYGRHGSRWMTSDERYIKVAQQFDDESNLTPKGLKVKKLIIKARDNAMGHGGKLSKLGELQHKGIANRQYRNREVEVDSTSMADTLIMAENISR